MNKDYVKIPLIYVAGKLTDDTVDYLRNVHRMMGMAQMVKKAGYAYFCPAIDLLMGIKFDYKDYYDYFDNGQVILSRCDGVLLTPGWETSEGTKKEMEYAVSLGIPVFHDLLTLTAFFKQKELL